MKILLMIPLDEKWSYIAAALYKNLDTETQNNTFCMPMFTEWQLATHNMIIGKELVEHWNVATFGSIVKAREMYHLQDAANKDFLLIGNINPGYKFDAIFNFQDILEDMPYKDLYIEKMREVFKDEPALAKNLVFYDATASKMPLHNIKATAQFLSSYMKTDPHIDEIKAQYKNSLQFKDKEDE